MSKVYRAEGRGGRQDTLIGAALQSTLFQSSKEAARTVLRYASVRARAKPIPLKGMASC